MNSSKSSRYHRARRRAAVAAWLLNGAWFGGLLLSGLSLTLRDAVQSSPWRFAGVLFGVSALLILPFAWYRTVRLDRQYGLASPAAASWLAAQAVVLGAAIASGAALAELAYRAMGWSPWWWLFAAAGYAALGAAGTLAAPLLLLPLTRRSKALSKQSLWERVQRLSTRAGVGPIGIHEVASAEGSRRATAALVGAGRARRILLSDTLLADYSDDEIEVMLAHEMGHEVNRDVAKSAALELLLVAAAFAAAAGALHYAWAPLGLSSPGDVAGLPLLVVTVSAVLLAGTPLLNAWSRAHERRADRFALETASEPAAFIGAVRRMAAQNLAEEHPSRAAFLLFHTHPTVEQRIQSARDVLRTREDVVSGRPAAPSCRDSGRPV